MMGVIEVHQPCSICGGSDPVAIYEDHSYCFSCEHHEFTSNKKRKPIMNNTRDWTPLKGEFMALKVRKITEITCKKFGYTVGKDHGGNVIQIADYRKDGQLVGQKIRGTNKDFKWLGEKNPPLFGQHLWKMGGKRIVITEGEIDSLSISQVQDNKWPVVSLPNGVTSAVKSIKNNLEYLNSFEQVVIAMDNDEAGKKAAYNIAPLLAPGKAFIAELPLKDASDMLVAGRTSELIHAMWQAIPYTPEGLVNGATLFEEMNKVEPEGLSYPWEGMTKALHGIRLQEIIILVASTGIGKSQVLKEIAYHLNIVHKQSLGLFFLEESNKITAQNLVGMSAEIPLHLPEYSIDIVEKKEHFDKVFGHGRIHLFNKYGAVDIEDISAKMRYLAVSCGVKYFFVDHVSCFAIAKEAIADERKTIDVVIAVFAELVRELDVTMFLVSHINRNSRVSYDDGGEPSLNAIRSSAGLAQWSSQIIGLSRNTQAEDASDRNITKVRVLKDRFAGLVGETFNLRYNRNTGRISEIEWEEDNDEAF